MSETQRNHEEINKLMTNQKFDLLRDKLAELKADTDPQIFQDLSGPNWFAGRGFRYQAYEEIVERIVTFFREHCTPEWYPNNAVERPFDELVSEYSGCIEAKEGVGDHFRIYERQGQLCGKAQSSSGP